MGQEQLSRVNGSRVVADMAMSNGSDQRVFELEREVGNLRVNNASLGTSVEHLAKAVETLTSTVDELRDTMNKGRGALWVAMVLAGAFGAAVATGLKKLLGIV